MEKCRIFDSHVFLETIKDGCDGFCRGTHYLEFLLNKTLSFSSLPNFSQLLRPRFATLSKSRSATPSTSSNAALSRTPSTSRSARPCRSSSATPSTTRSVIAPSLPTEEPATEEASAALVEVEAMAEEPVELRQDTEQPRPPRVARCPGRSASQCPGRSAGTCPGRSPGRSATTCPDSSAGTSPDRSAGNEF